MGRKKLILPGLNTPVKRGFDLVKQERGADDPSWYVYKIKIIRKNRCQSKS